MLENEMNRRVERLSISQDQDRRSVVASVRAAVAEPSKPKRRRRRSSAQSITPKPKRKKKRLRGPDLEVDPNLVKKRVSIADIRDLIVYIFNESPSNVRWLQVHNHLDIKKAVVVLVPGLHPSTFGHSFPDPEQVQPVPLDQAKEPLELADLGIFSHIWPSRAPGSKIRVFSAYQTLVNVPLTKARRKTQSQNTQPAKIEELVMSLDELVANKYPLHLSLEKELRKDHSEAVAATKSCLSQRRWVETTLTDKEPKIYAIDCEMCKAGPEQVLARVSMVDSSNSVILDVLVKPEQEITDYVTKYLGITEEMLSKATWTHEDVQKRLLELVGLQDVLIGHSLELDLRVLRLRHPRIVDTALVFDHTFGPPLKPALRWLASKFLGRDIQNNVAGHNSIEDAVTCMDLIKAKLENGLGYGRSALAGVDIFTKINTKAVDRCVAQNAQNKAGADDHVSALQQSVKKSLVLDCYPASKLCAKPYNVEVGERIQCLSDEANVDAVLERIGNVDLVVSTLRGMEKKEGEDEESQKEKEKKIQELLLKLVKGVPGGTLVCIYGVSGDAQEPAKLQAKKRDFQNGEEGSSWSVEDEDALAESVMAAREAFFLLGLKKESTELEDAVIDDDDDDTHTEDSKPGEELGHMGELEECAIEDE